MPRNLERHGTRSFFFYWNIYSPRNNNHRSFRLSFPWKVTLNTLYFLSWLLHGKDPHMPPLYKTNTFLPPRKPLLTLAIVVFLEQSFSSSNFWYPKQIIINLRFWNCCPSVSEAQPMSYSLIHICKIKRKASYLLVFPKQIWEVLAYFSPLSHKSLQFQFKN